MVNRSRSTLFLIEQLIVIAVFAICAAACIRILTTAYFYASDSNAASNALLAAESVAESYKAFGGDPTDIAGVINGFMFGDTDGAGYYVHYDKDWRVCSDADAVYVLKLAYDKLEWSSFPSASDSLITAELTVRKDTGEILVAFPIAARLEGRAG